jgi:glutaredoxin 3
MMAEIDIYTRKMCGFCTAAKSLLTKKGAAFREFDATFDSKLRQEMMKKSGRTTFPQIFINGNHVGGCDELHALERAGKLDPMLKTG